MGLLQIVYLETNDADAELVGAELKNCGVESDLIRVGCQEELLGEMTRQPIDLVLADPSCTTCEGLRALAIAREQQAGVPFIFLASSDEPGQVAEALHNGATDFIFKHHLSKLGPSICRVIEAKRTQRDLENARSMASAHNVEIKGTLHVHATLGLGQRLVAPAVREFLAHYPDVHIDLAIGPHTVNVFE